VASILNIPLLTLSRYSHPSSRTLNRWCRFKNWAHIQCRVLYDCVLSVLSGWSKCVGCCKEVCK